MRIAIVGARFNEKITDAMVERAQERIRELDQHHAGTLRVPGVFDSPLAVKRCLQRDQVDGVAVLGAVVTGDTDHDQVLMHATTKTLQELSLEHGKPVALGITGPGMSAREARERVAYGSQAVEAVVETLQALENGSSLDGPEDR